LTGADIESLCKKATLSAIVEIQRGKRLAPFVVTRGISWRCWKPIEAIPSN